MTGYLTRAREPMSSFTHLIGAVVFGAASLPLLLKCWLSGNATPVNLVSLLAFCLSITAMYCASAYFHYYNKDNPARLFRLRKLDHSMIYVLIAGTYTPIVLTYLDSPDRLYFSIFIWSFALAGIIMKLCWFHMPRWLSTGLYIVMGWSIMLDFSAFWNMPVWGLILMAAGGVSYTAGGVIYGLQRPNPSPNFGFHEVFHLFILGGSFFHYLVMLFFIA